MCQSTRTASVLNGKRVTGEKYGQWVTHRCSQRKDGSRFKKESITWKIIPLLLRPQAELKFRT